MVKARTWFTLCIISLGTVAATASCGSDEATGGNTAGMSGGGLLGNAGKSGGTSRAGAGGGPATTTSLLAAECTEDADCGDGWTCFTTSTLASGGPANGLCTKKCDAPSDCSELQPGANCFTFETGTSFCMAGCEMGTPDDSTQKCQGRPDLACRDFSETDEPEAYCFPLCRDDLECGPGSFCSLKSGFCTPTKPSGKPAGSACTPGAQVDECAGYCLSDTLAGVDPVPGVCVELCSGFLACGYTGQTPGGLCAGGFTADFGLFDLGYCVPNCSCTGECPFKNDVCRAWSSSEQDLGSALGAPGLCLSSADGSTELPACMNGSGNAAGAGGVGGEGGVAPSAGAAGDSASGGTSGAAN